MCPPSAPATPTRSFVKFPFHRFRANVPPKGKSFKRAKPKDLWFSSSSPVHMPILARHRKHIFYLIDGKERNLRIFLLSFIFSPLFGGGFVFYFGNKVTEWMRTNFIRNICFSFLSLPLSVETRGQKFVPFKNQRNRDILNVRVIKVCGGCDRWREKKRCRQAGRCWTTDQTRLELAPISRTLTLPHPLRPIIHSGQF